MDPCYWSSIGDASVCSDRPASSSVSRVALCTVLSPAWRTMWIAQGTFGEIERFRRNKLGEALLDSKSHHFLIIFSSILLSAQHTFLREIPRPWPNEVGQSTDMIAMQSRKAYSRKAHARCCPCCYRNRDRPLTQVSVFPPSGRAVVLCDAIECMYIMQNELDCGRGPCWRARE